MALPIVIVILGALFFFCPSHLWAKTMYITDRIELNLRSGTGLEFRPLAMVKTGDRVEVLEGDKNWSKVRLTNGTIGWINTCFLVDQVKAAGLPDSKTQEELRSLKDANQTLIREKGFLIQEKNRLLKEVEEVKDQRSILNPEKQPRNSPELNELKAKNEQLDKEITLYKKQIAQFNQNEKRGINEDRIQWFLIGSVVLAVGLLLGWLLSRGRKKPPRYY
jgi:SH3 domain protein